MSDLDAQRYEKRYPGTGIPDAQKEERQQREDFKTERRTHGRTGRNRSVVFSIVDNEWLNGLPASQKGPR